LPPLPPEFVIVYNTGNRIWSPKEAVVTDLKPTDFYNYIEANNDIKGTTFDVKERERITE
jgi:hypothetical protein